MAKIKFKNIIKEHNLGVLPSEKLIKMKWNPLTEAEPTDEPINESGYIELISMDSDYRNGLDDLVTSWETWKNGPATEKHDIRPAQKEFMNAVNSFLKKYIK